MVVYMLEVDGMESTVIKDSNHGWNVNLIVLEVFWKSLLYISRHLNLFGACVTIVKPTVLHLTRLSLFKYFIPNQTCLNQNDEEFDFVAMSKWPGSLPFPPPNPSASPFS